MNKQLLDVDKLEDILTSLEESEMEMFRFLKDRPAGAVLVTETDMMLARVLESEGLAECEEVDILGNPVSGKGTDDAGSGPQTEVRLKAWIPEMLRLAYKAMWSDEQTLRWRKRNWMYKCIEAGKYLYGVMTWDVLGKLFALRYPHAEMDEIKEIFNSTPGNLQWFTERDGKLVLNGFERDNYYKYLEEQVQRDLSFYIPTKEEVAELYDQGCLISREAHARLQDYIAETFGCSKDIAGLKVHELYEAVNNRVRVNEAVDVFTKSGIGAADGAESYERRSDFAFPSDEVQVRFIELYLEMSRECRVRDNRGHDYYEMVAIMAEKNRRNTAKKAPVKRVKIGRNDPCPCGSGKKYKNCCGRN